MKFFSNRKINRMLLLTNILTVIALVFIAVREKYPSRIYNIIFPPPAVKWDYRWNQAYENCTSIYPLYNEQKNIVMLGNSLTAYANWEELLQRQDIANRGIGGDITEGFMARLKYILTLKPKICFIEGGVNDLYRNVPQDSIIENLNNVITALQSEGIKPVLTTATFVSEKYKVNNAIEENSKIRKLNTGIYRLAKQKQVSLIDLNQYISDDHFLKPEYGLRDGVHFTGKTYLIWKQEIEKVLKCENI